MRIQILASLVGVTVFGCATQAVDRIDNEAPAKTPDGNNQKTPDLGQKPGTDKPVETPPTSTVFYAHTDKELFIVEPSAAGMPVRSAGLFDCVGSGKDSRSITDLAVDKTGRIFLVGTPASGKQSYVFLDVKIVGNVVQCQGKGVRLNAEGTFLGATFAPAGTVLPNAEALVVANDEGNLYEVNTSTADTTLLGNFGMVPAADNQGNSYPAKNVGSKFALSGDIVFMAGNGSPLGFATVRDRDAKNVANKTDTLVEIDMSKLRAGNTNSVVKKVRGQVVKSASCADSNESYGSMFGVAAYGDQIYGFARTKDDSGKAVAQIVRIDNSTGAACLVADQTLLTKAGFSGAGVTTSVQVSVPVQ